MISDFEEAILQRVATLDVSPYLEEEPQDDASEYLDPAASMWEEGYDFVNVKINGLDLERIIYRFSASDHELRHLKRALRFAKVCRYQNDHIFWLDCGPFEDPGDVITTCFPSGVLLSFESNVYQEILGGSIEDLPFVSTDQLKKHFVARAVAQAESPDLNQMNIGECWQEFNTLLSLTRRGVEHGQVVFWPISDTRTVYWDCHGDYPQLCIVSFQNHFGIRFEDVSDEQNELITFSSERRARTTWPPQTLFSVIYTDAISDFVREHALDSLA